MKLWLKILLPILAAVLLATGVAVLCLGGGEEAPKTTVEFHGQSYPLDTKELDLSNAPLDGLDQLVLLRDLQLLDLRGTGMTTEQYRIMQGLYSDCRILWDPMFQGVSYPENTQKLQAQTLTVADIEELAFFPQLEQLDASACRDYEMLLRLMRTYPNLDVHYEVEMGGTVLQTTATSAEFSNVTAEELAHGLLLLPELQSVMLKGQLPELVDLLSFRDQYPQVEIRWRVEIYGRVFDGDDKEIDLCGIPMENVSLVEEKSRYFSQLEKVLMWDCGISNEEMEALNQRNDGPLFVWKVSLGEHVTVRTDIDNFICHKYGHFLREGECENFRYCTELVALDLGHRGIATCDFLQYMPKLKYLILAHTYVTDFTPLTGLENLVFLEVFMLGDVKSFEPFLSLTGLEDLNIGYTHARDGVKVLEQMTWLKRLWWSDSRLSAAQQRKLQEALPNTQLCMWLEDTSTGGGWRKNPNYYAMRELLGMPDESYR